ncbi:hypothetical protein DSECCO2_582450 [anaerobic digester metagenome]
MEFAIKDVRYRASVMDAFTQLHVVRRLAPVLGTMAPLVGKDAERDQDVLLKGLADCVAGLKDEDVEYILNACLDAAERRNQGGGWAPVRKDGATMFPVGAAALLLIAFHVIRHNLSGFFADLPSLSGLEGLMSKLNG